MKKWFSVKQVFVLALVIAVFTGLASASDIPWSFGVMSDTQWIGADDGRNPNTVSVDVIKALNQEFIKRGVKFVVQVGDLVDQTGLTPASVATAEDTRAAFAQELFNARIGFFPIRGNHDANNLAGYEFKRIYPQTLTGLMNATPADVFSVLNPDAALQPFPTVKGKPFTLGANFSTPNPGMTNNLDWTGLSYSFDFSNARFVMLDQFTPLQADTHSTLSQNPAPNAIDFQQSWISGVLSGKPSNTHAFVFSHKGLISENHVDTLFGSDPSKDPAGQDAFITSLYSNGVRYFFQGHDHMHDRSLISVTTGTPTDGISAKVQNILCASDSSKFYTPGNPSNDDKYDVPAFGHKRQAQIAQELHTTGYYIFTVDGPRVIGEYYSAFPSNVAPDNCSGPNCEWLIHATPTLNFIKTETFGYSLNGKEFQVCQVGQLNCNSSYTQVIDSYDGTTAKILSGVNGSAARDFDDRNLIKTVNTGWASVDNRQSGSTILTLWGMADLGTERTDVYTLSMTYDRRGNGRFENGSFGLATKDEGGNWINAVDMNFGGVKKFVSGPWDPSYKLGTYGIDPSTHTAWAVINYNGDFAVTNFENPYDLGRWAYEGR
jgi:hypothetical protein